MKTNLLIRTFFLCTLTVVSLHAAVPRQIAITIDDLPFVGEKPNYHLEMMLNTLKSEEVPATGFIIAGKVRKENWPVLHKFQEAGFSLGNHTLTHANLNRMGAEAFIHEIDEADKILNPVLTEPKFFRYPYLAESHGLKKDTVLSHLAEKHYQVAPITIDSRDYIFNQMLMAVPEKQRRDFLKALKPCYLDFIRQQTLQAEESSRINHKPHQAQILLIHANLLNAYVLPDLIKSYRKNGFKFVRLSDALKTFSKNYKPVETLGNEDDFLAWDEPV